MKTRHVIDRLREFAAELVTHQWSASAVASGLKLMAQELDSDGIEDLQGTPMHTQAMRYATNPETGLNVPVFCTSDGSLVPCWSKDAQGQWCFIEGGE